MDDFQFLLWGVLAFIVSSLVSLLLVVIVIVQMPANYFLDSPDRQLWVDRHRILRIALRVAKNLLGIVLILAGVMLSVPGIPGQGILTILIGVMLLDMPGKRRWERRIAKRPRILRTINRLRATFHKKPLRFPEDDRFEC